MKKFKLIQILTLGLFMVACTKNDEYLDVDLSTYNSDTYVPTLVDNWISENITKPYNIEVVYRFERNLTDVSKDIAPVKYDKVQPIMEAVHDGFIKAYAKVGGETFIKTYTPKQFVLYGSGSYNTNGSITLGTAEGGRKIVLYSLNEIDFENPDMSLDGSNTVRRRLRTIHHEFTHIVNQIVAIPPAFEQISKADYEADWTNNDSNPESVSRSLGFISRYARSAYTEDFAEVTAHLLVQGQLWYDQYAKASGEEAYTKLKQKEAIVVDYFNEYFNIDFKELQREVQRVLHENYGDITNQSFAYWLKQGNLISSLGISPTNAHYAKYGTSSKFDAIFQSAKTAVAAVGNAGRTLNELEFSFLNATDLEVIMYYNNTAGSHYQAFYSFSMAVDEHTGEVTFTKVAQRGADEGVWSNAEIVADGFTPIQDYLTSHTFIADWLPGNVETEDWLRLGGFYVKDEVDNYFYGGLTF
ncbi:hypothetical protein G5B30_01330 [Sphingobacterium sp. SGG-5]|uniref:substrate import-associated zinc metallohydrolase lipoprotein n=1 Tax=Sphingobacterium sp. SGG-5 TaxID=2710881 RepID=UPI0013EC8011|nr:substrate import-associated zinc metallohydrolase lipoprotein [Sphingobacterium sp. SGG-5]NGM60546.1 hypothetical protein [Sphingobacterium sp. SGG-5]